MLEKEIEKQILEYLELLPECYAWKNPTVGVYDARKGIYRRPQSRFHIKGASDILGLYKGKFLAIEVKSEKGRVSKYQKDFLENIKFNGGIAFVARSVKDVLENLGLSGE